MANRNDTLLLAEALLGESMTALRISRSRMRGGRYDRLVAKNKIFEAVMSCEKVARQLRGKFGLEG